MLDISPRPVGERIAARLAELRSAEELSLDALARSSGVSRSTISLIERGESSPTAVVLDKLARALGVTLSALFDPDPVETPSDPVARRRDQACWQDPESGYRRRNVSPPGVRQPMRIAEVHFPAGARVTFDNGRDDDAMQQVWVLDGTIEILVGDVHHALHRGDCLAMRLDQPTTFANPGRKTARYAVVTATQSAANPTGRSA